MEKCGVTVCRIDLTLNRRKIKNYENFFALSSFLLMVESSKPIDFLKNAPEPTLYATGIYLFKVNDVITRTMCEISSKLTIKTPE